MLFSTSLFADMDIIRIYSEFIKLTVANANNGNEDGKVFINYRPYTSSDLATIYYSKYPVEKDKLSIEAHDNFNTIVLFGNFSTDLKNGALAFFIEYYQTHTANAQDEYFVNSIIRILYSDKILPYLSTENRQFINDNEKALKTYLLNFYQNKLNGYTIPLEASLSVAGFILSDPKHFTVIERQAAVIFINNISINTLKSYDIFNVLFPALTNKDTYDIVDRKLIKLLFPEERLEIFNNVVVDQELPLAIRESALEYLKIIYEELNVGFEQELFLFIATIDKKELTEKLWFRDLFFKNQSYNKQQLSILYGTLLKFKNPNSIYSVSFKINILKAFSVLNIFIENFTISEDLYASLLTTPTFLANLEYDIKLQIKKFIDTLFTFLRTAKYKPSLTPQKIKELENNEKIFIFNYLTGEDDQVLSKYLLYVLFKLQDTYTSKDVKEINNAIEKAFKTRIPYDTYDKCLGRVYNVLGELIFI